MTQHDYTIDNASGSAVRDDIEKALQALNSQNSEGTAPTSNIDKFTPWSDTTNNILKRYSGSSWISHRRTNGTVIIPDGSASNPSIEFSDDSDTGIYSPSSNQVGITTAGSVKLTIGGSVTSAVEFLAPDGNWTAPQYSFSSDTNTGLYKYSADNLGITTGGAACAVFNSDGLSLWNGKKVKLYDTGSSHSVSHKAPALTANVEFTWPSDAGSNGQVLATNGSGTLSWQASVNDPPVGSIVMWPSATVPSGWLHCNGQSVSRDTYQDLFNVLSVNGVPIYGADDANHFDVPDMRGLFVRGWDNSAGTDPDASSRTNRGDSTTGDNVGTKQGDLVKTHTHTYVDQQNDGNGGYRWWKGGDNDCKAADKETESTGGNESRPKNIAMMYIIRAT